jgi:hypothetical protein
MRFDVLNLINADDVFGTHKRHHIGRPDAGTAILKPSSDGCACGRRRTCGPQCHEENILRDLIFGGMKNSNRPR